jgi:hypothetical protein
MSTIITQIKGKNVGKVASKKILERKYEMRDALLKINNTIHPGERDKLLDWVKKYPDEEKEISNILEAEKQAESDRKDEDIRSANRSIQENEKRSIQEADQRLVVRETEKKKLKVEKKSLETELLSNAREISLIASSNSSDDSLKNLNLLRDKIMARLDYIDSIVNRELYENRKLKEEKLRKLKKEKLKQREDEHFANMKKNMERYYQKRHQQLIEKQHQELVEKTCINEYKCCLYPPMFPKMKCVEDGCNNIANYTQKDGTYWKCYNHATLLELTYSAALLYIEIHHTDFVTSRKRMAANGRMKTFLMGTSPTINEKPNKSAVYTGMVSNYCYEPKLFGIIKDFL